MPTPPLSNETVMDTVRIWRENEENIDRTSRFVGLSRHAVQNRIRIARERGLLDPDKPAIKAAPIRQKAKPRTLDDFRKQYDDSLKIPQQIQDGIEKYLRENGEPAWLKDFEFRELCGVSTSKWRRYADDYKHLQVRVGSEIVWGHPEIIDDMRRAVAR